MTAGDEDRRVVVETLFEHLGELLRRLERLLRRLPLRGDGLVVLRVGPPFELARFAVEGRDVDLLAGLGDVVHRQERFDGVIAGGEERLVLH
ncbi:hypothetical protein, partial [Catellatospora coxensis]|uniref:hypothetical protein n=1 Tax=Catellatospora coxensis TaxID=310354 RepID=UPI0031D8DE28